MSAHHIRPDDPDSHSDSGLLRERGEDTLIWEYHSLQFGHEVSFSGSHEASAPGQSTRASSLLILIPVEKTSTD